MDEYRVTQTLLKTMALSTIVAGVIGSATGIVLGRWGIAVPPMLVIALGLFAYRLTLRGHTRPVAILLVCGLCIFSVLQAMTAAGPLSAAWMCIPVPSCYHSY